jgi:hypothetical protein
MQLLLSALLELPVVIAGHTYDTGAAPVGEGDGDEAGGIGTAAILVALVLTVVTVGILASLDPGAARAKLRTLMPGMMLAALVAAPLVVWAGSAGGEEKALIVERGPGVTGKNEFIVSLGDEDLNRLETTRGIRTVRLECRGRDGELVLRGEQRWPFVNERGFEYPHTHQAASREQLLEADRCRLRGTSVRLEAEVEGALTR